MTRSDPNSALKTFVLTYSYAPEMLERRQPYRAEHLERVRAAHTEGKLLLAGGFSDPVDGAVLVWQAQGAGEILRWVADDPYTRAGLIYGVAVREITLVVGAPS